MNPHREGDIRSLVTALPKAEHHHHFAGAVPWEAVRTLSREPLPERPAWWDRTHRMTDWAEFSAAMNTIWYHREPTIEQIGEVARAMFRDLAARNVVYLETTMALGSAGERGMPPEDVLTVMKRAAPASLALRVYAVVRRNEEDIARLADVLFGMGELLDGIDLCGHELEGDARRFRRLFEGARARGLDTKAHAGEAGGPEKVAEVVDVLGVRAVQHGMAAHRDPALMRRLREEGVRLNLCPWSNVKLGFVRDMASHPIREIHRSGVSVTVSTDDPTAFGCSLVDELTWLVTEAGMTLEEAVEIARNGLRFARVEEGVRAGWMSAFEAARRK